MSILKYTSLFFSLVLALSLISSCGSKSDVKDKTGKEYTSAYICPMHCDGSGSDSAGKCPVCKMDYVMNENATKPAATEGHEGHNHSHEGHDHNHSHDGHDHNHDHSHDGHNH